MTALTDLPNELLELIFREYLFQFIEEGEYVCTWWYDEDDGPRRTRAALDSLCLVSKAISKIALLLLYEQLFEKGDFRRFILSNPKPTSHMILQRIARIRCLHIELGEDPENQTQQLSPTRLQAYLAHCNNVEHLRLAYHGPFSTISAFLQYLAQLSGFAGLQSLQISLDIHGDARTLTRDLSGFDQLEGLSITFNCNLPLDMDSPLQPLAHLKHLATDSAEDTSGTAALVDLAFFDRLQVLGIWQSNLCGPEIASLSQLLGEHTWHTLTSLFLDGLLLEGHKIVESHSTRLPALRELRLVLDSVTSLTDTLPTLPYGLERLELGNMSVWQWEPLLTLIKDGSWLGGSLREIALELRDLDSADLKEWEKEGESRADLLLAAEEAILATRARHVRLEPTDLVDRLAGLFCRRSARQ